MTREPCSYCGGLADPASTCPRAVTCPRCAAGPGSPCYAPSGHRRDELHSARVALAESTAIPSEEDHVSQFAQFTLSGELETLELEPHPAAGPAQLGLLEIPPASTYAGEYGPAADALETLPLAESMRAPHRVRRSR